MLAMMFGICLKIHVTQFRGGTASGFWIIMVRGLVQMYTGTGADGMTERNFRVHLQLWDTAGQER